MLKSFSLPALAILVASAPASAADQGAIGATSRGAVFISVSVASQTRVSGLRDTELRDGRAALGICAQSNTRTRLFSVAPTVTGEAGQAPQTDHGMHYTVAWAARADTARDQVADPYTAICERRALIVSDERTGSSRSTAGIVTLLVTPD